MFFRFVHVVVAVLASVYMFASVSEAASCTTPNELYFDDEWIALAYDMRSTACGSNWNKVATVLGNVRTDSAGHKYTGSMYISGMKSQQVSLDAYKFYYLANISNRAVGYVMRHTLGVISHSLDINKF